MVETEKGFIEVNRDFVLTQDQLEFVKENPAGLTKEGCEEEIRNWKKSSNKRQKMMYEYMLKNCKIFTESGTIDGRIIFARDSEGKARWVEPKERRED